MKPLTYPFEETSFMDDLNQISFILSLKFIKFCDHTFGIFLSPQRVYLIIMNVLNPFFSCFKHLHIFYFSWWSECSGWFQILLMFCLIRLRSRLLLFLGEEYLVFVSSRSLKRREKKYKLRQLCLSQFVYCLREVCLSFNFWRMKVQNYFFLHNEMSCIR